MYLVLILHVLSSSSVGTTPFYQYQLFAVHVLQEIGIFNLNKGLLLSIICLQLTMCTFTFFCEILLHKYHIDGKHVRVYHSLICQQASFLAIANSKYGH
jgi:hypothetical protein